VPSKNNLNVLFIMLITMLFLAVMGGVSVGLSFIAPWWLGCSILLLLVTTISVGLYLWILSLAENNYKHYEI